MNKKKILFGLLLFGLGAIGVLSLLTMDIPLPPESEAMLKARFSPEQLKLIILLNPTLMLMFAVLVGSILYREVNFKAPLLERIVGIEIEPFDLGNILKFGILGGVLSGILLSLISLVFIPILPAEFIELGESLKPSLAARFLYGGITEEILMRFGFMTLVVYLTSKIFRGTKPFVYWVGIIIAALLFAIGHFPVAFLAVSSPTTGLLTYILIGNTVGGVIFGWLYWKKGLESAFLAHMFAHVVMVLAEPLLS